MPKHKFTNTQLVQNVKIRALHAEGLGHVYIARALGMHTSIVYRRMKKLGLEMKAPNGSHRRVDVCECGKPALERGSKCADCDRIRKSIASRNSYRRKNNVPESKWRRVA